MRARVTLLAAILLVGALVVRLAPSFAQPAGPSSATPPSRAQVERGRALFVEGCSSCHGFDARGVPNQGPTLRGAGALAADFYLRTGRMPLANPGDEPLRSEPRYTDGQIRALDAYVGSFGGPAIPSPDPARGDLSQGQKLFTSYCAGCHTVTGEGGVATGAAAPRILEATPTEVAEAIRMGPFLMPKFGSEQIDAGQMDSITRYVDYVRHPDDAGGWSIGRIGPVPEGMVAWLLAAVALILVALVIGERRREGRG